MVKDIQFADNQNYQLNENGYMKVDEDTLYIVEKKLNINGNFNIVPVNAEIEIDLKDTPTSISETKISTTDIVDKEIRKNFELKPKTESELFQNNIEALIIALRNSINHISKSEPSSNDFQLHYFKMKKSNDNKVSHFTLYFEN